MMPSDVSAELAPGMLIGRYRLVFPLGKGGMGEVWAATVTQADLGFSKLFALKVLETRDFASNAAVMFRDEAKAASELQHRSIVRTTDHGVDGHMLYLAMELVRGPSLTALLQRLVLQERRMSPAIVAHLGLQLSSALDYAYGATYQGRQLKLVHRDVSPHNVLLDLNGAVRLTDFGVARTTIQSHLSHVGTVRGKPSYMAPEQVVGGDIDARTDVFALGIVLYESSCLKRLFGRSNPVKSMDAVLKHTPRALPELVPDFPEPLWRVIQRALEKEPAQRHQSAAEMHQALLEAARGLPQVTSAERDLVQLVDSVFEPGAFDIEGRVQEVLQSIPAEVEAGPEYEPSVMRTVAQPWPTSSAPEPLAPEAIEDVRTAYRPWPQAPMEAPMQAPWSATSVSSSMGSFTPGSAQSLPLVQPVPARRVSGPVIVASFLVAAGVFAGAAALIARANGGSAVSLRVSAPPPAEAPVVQAQPSVRQGAPAASRPPPELARVAPPTLDPAPDPGPADEGDDPNRRSRRAAQPAPGRKVVPGSEPSPATPGDTPKKEAPTPSADATYDEVNGLLRRVKEIDPKRHSALLVTLLEAGRDNPEKLNQLRREARQILGRPSAP